MGSAARPSFLLVRWRIRRVRSTRLWSSGRARTSHVLLLDWDWSAAKDDDVASDEGRGQLGGDLHGRSASGVTHAVSPGGAARGAPRVSCAPVHATAPAREYAGQARLRPLTISPAHASRTPSSHPSTTVTKPSTAARVRTVTRNSAAAIHPSCPAPNDRAIDGYRRQRRDAASAHPDAPLRRFAQLH